jgi:hypothetical protein
MNPSKSQAERILALLLVSSLAACNSGSEQVAEQQAAAEPAASTEQPAAVEDRFANMFVAEVSDAFNPGLQIGEQFPAIRGLYQGEEVMSIDRFVRDKGAIFIAARSVDW